MTTTPLSAERLAEIRERHATDARDPYLDECDNMTREAHADRAALLAHVESLQAALRQAEEERLELAWFGLLPDELPDDVDWRRAHEVAELAKRIVDGVAAANGGRDGG